MQQLKANGRATWSRRLTTKARAVLATAAPPAALPAVPRGKNGVRVTFKIPYGTIPGQSLGVIGSASALGDWKTEQALKMKWTPGNVWTADFLTDPSVPSIEYKYILMESTGKVVAWSKDPNRKLEVGSLAGSAITVAEQWEAGPREIRLIVQGMSQLDSHASAARNAIPEVPSTSAISAQDAAQEGHVYAVQGQLQEINERLLEFDELRRDVARLVAAGPLPPWVSSKQLMELTQQLSAFEDLRDVVSELAGMGTLQLKMSADQLADVSEKLSRYMELEGSLNALVGQLSQQGGCPVGYAVGKSIAAAARNRSSHRPYHW